MSIKGPMNKTEGPGDQTEGPRDKPRSQVTILGWLVVVRVVISLPLFLGTINKSY